MLDLSTRPTYSELSEELYRQICSAQSSAVVKITLSKKYSHRAIKKVLRHLGYAPKTRKPEHEFTIIKKTKR